MSNLQTAAALAAITGLHSAGLFGQYSDGCVSAESYASRMHRRWELEQDIGRRVDTLTKPPKNGPSPKTLRKRQRLGKEKF